MDKLLSFRTAEELTGIKIPTWRAWAARRLFPVVRLGRRVKIRECDLVRFIDERTTPVKPERVR
jgi:hypothetical protein